LQERRSFAGDVVVDLEKAITLQANFTLPANGEVAFHLAHGGESTYM
jgi:hypothetical protein